MRICSLRFQNINSLRSTTPFEISFVEGPLATTGLFAITGDTGSGKTTILDAITLGLYGRTPRFRDDLGQIMSWGTVEALAEVEFDSGGKRYRAKWNLWRAHQKPDGKLQPARRELAVYQPDLEEYVILAEKVREVDARLMEITGLDYDRFTKSVLLSQGEFAAFLKADERDRSALLERITGTAVYSDLSKAAYERYREEQQTLERLQDRLGHLELLSPEEVEEKEAEQSQRAEQVKALDEELRQLRAQLEVWQSMDRLQERLQQWEVEQARWEAENRAFAPHREALEAHRRLAEALPAWQGWQRSKSRLLEFQTIAERLQQSIAELDAHWQRALARQEQARQKAKQAEAKLKEALPRLAKARELDVELRRKRDRLDTLQREWDEQNRKLGHLTSRAEKEERELAGLQEELDQADRWLSERVAWDELAGLLPLLKREEENRNALRQKLDAAEAERVQLRTLQEAGRAEAGDQLAELNAKREKRQAVSAGLQQLVGKGRDPLQTLQVWRKQLEEKRQAITAMEQGLGHARRYRSLLEEQQALKKRHRRLQKTCEAKRKEEKKLEEACREAEAVVQQRRSMLEAQLLLVNYARDRAGLRSGTPCPLCGSTEHPFEDHPPEPFEDRARKDLEVAEAEWNRLTDLHRTIREEYLRQAEEVRSLEADMEERLARELEALRGELENAPHGGEDPDAMAGRLERSQIEASRLQEQIGEVESRLEERAALDGACEPLNRSLNELQQEQAGREERLRRLDEEVRQLQQELQLGEGRREGWLQPYAPWLEKDVDPLPALEDFARSFRKRKEAQKERESHMQMLGQQLKNSRAAVSEISEQLTGRDRDRQSLIAEVEELEKARSAEVGEADPDRMENRLRERLEEARRAMAELSEEERNAREQKAKSEERWTMLNEQMESEQTVLQEQEKEVRAFASRHQLSGPEELNARLLDDQTARTYEKQEQELARQQTALQREHRQLLDEQEALAEQADREPSRDLLEKKLQELAGFRDEAVRRSGALAQELDNYRRMLKNQAGLQEKLLAQKRERDRWARLNELIGQADGKKFRTFAQGLTLRQLVRSANEHLRQLHGRYRIEKVPDQLELQIVDTFQADNQRSMNTLSGGESFLVSLALALGLSDMAGQQAEIRSLFIDEGFGTLDDAALDLALSTLENLQARGKTIGIISHVNALKERIAVQIQLEKGSSGFSSLKIIPTD